MVTAGTEEAHVVLKNAWMMLRCVCGVWRRLAVGISTDGAMPKGFAGWVQSGGGALGLTMQRGVVQSGGGALCFGAWWQLLEGGAVVMRGAGLGLLCACCSSARRHATRSCMRVHQVYRSGCVERSKQYMRRSSSLAGAS